MRTLPHVDRVGVAERVGALAKRSIKGDAKRQQLEPKEELKKRLGRSPDLGDCFTMSFLCGPDLPAMPLVENPAESSYVDPMPAVEVVTPDARTLRMLGIQ